MKKFFIGFYDYTVVLTYISLFFAMLGIFQADRGNFTLSVICVALSGVCDAFDGAVARTKKNRTEDEKNFGIQLDSICDVIAFGVAPAMICYFMGVNKGAGLILVFLYVLAALIRLAFFNVLEIKRQKAEGGCAKYYVGLPVTSISIILPIVYAFKFVLRGNHFLIILRVMLAAVALLFVSNFKIKKIKFDNLISNKVDLDTYEDNYVNVATDNK